MRKVMIAGVAGAVVAVAGIGVYVATQNPEVSDPDAPTPVADVETTRIVFDPELMLHAGDGLFEVPSCGDEFAPDAQDVNGVMPVASVQLYDDSHWATEDLDALEIRGSFTSDSEQEQFFVAQTHNYIVTRDGLVVHTSQVWEYSSSDFLSASQDEVMPAVGGTTLDGKALCTGEPSWIEQWEAIDWDTASDAEVDEFQRLWLEHENSEFEMPPGTYAVYWWSPIVLGEQAALKRLLQEEGFINLSYMTWAIGDSPAAGDPRLEGYCFAEDLGGGGGGGNDEDMHVMCDVPPEIVAEVLTRDVPVDYIVDVPTGIAISAPALIVVD